MKTLQLFIVFAMLGIAAAKAQDGKFYVDWDDAAKKCIIVQTKPTVHQVTGGGPFDTRAQAEAALKVVKGCSPESMKSK